MIHEFQKDIAISQWACSWEELQWGTSPWNCPEERKEGILFVPLLSPISHRSMFTSWKTNSLYFLLMSFAYNGCSEIWIAHPCSVMFHPNVTVWVWSGVPALIGCWVRAWEGIWDGAKIGVQYISPCKTRIKENLPSGQYLKQVVLYFAWEKRRIGVHYLNTTFTMSNRLACRSGAEK